VVLEIIALLIIALAAFIHYRAGLWAALLSLWAVLVSGAVAFGFFLPLSGRLLKSDPLKGVYYWSDGLCLLLVFTVAFALLRLIAERFLRNSMTFRLRIDTIAGPVVGAVAGYLLAGMLVVFAQMMPLPPGVMGYQPFDLDGKPGVRANRLIGRYDDATLGLYNALLGGALSGGEGNFAAHYPAANPLGASESKNRFRGSTVDDILYHYFRRRAQYALLSNKGSVYAGGKGKGVPLLVGKDAQIFSLRGQPGTEMKIEKVWMTPVLAWNDPAGQEIVLTPKNITWIPGGAEEEEKEEETKKNRKKAKDEKSGHSEESFLVVQVEFRPSKNEPRNILLRDWHLDSVMKDKKKSKVPSPRVVKMWMSAQTQGPEVIPEDPSTMKKDQASLLDMATVVRSIEKPDASKRSGWSAKGKTQILVHDANWTFVDNKRWARATLVFPVASLSMSWQYGLKCSSEDFVGTGRGRSKPQGLSKGRKMEFAPLKAEILGAGLFLRLGSKLALKAAAGNELMQVHLKLGKMSGRDSPKQLLLTSKEFRITNKITKKNYPAGLYEILSATEDAVASDVTTKKADYSYADPQSIEPAGGKKGERLSKNWEVYFESGSSSIILRLMFEVPRGKPLSQFDLKTVGQLSEEAPDWYLKKQAEKISARTHRVAVLEQGVVESVPRLLPSGKARPYKLAAGGAQDLLVVKLSIQPRKDDDRFYYILHPEGVGLRLSRGVAKEAVPFIFFRGPGEENYVARRRAKPVMVHDITVVEFAFAAPRERKRASIAIPGMRPAPLETPK